MIKLWSIWLAWSDKWRWIQVLWSKRNLKLISCLNDVNAWTEESLNAVVKWFDIIDFIILGFKADDLVFEAKDFLKPMGHSIIESLLGFYLDPFNLILEFERYHFFLIIESYKKGLFFICYSIIKCKYNKNMLIRFNFLKIFSWQLKNAD